MPHVDFNRLEPQLLHSLLISFTPPFLISTSPCEEFNFEITQMELATRRER